MCNTKRLCIALVCTWLVGLNAMAATVEFHESAPTPGVMDISNLVGATRDRDNVGTATADGSGNDGSTYVAMDRPAQGQTFLTGNDSDTYRMTGVWVQHCGYTANTDNTWYSLTAGNDLVIRVVDMSDNAEDFILYEDSYTITAQEPNILEGSTAGTTSSANGTGTWIHFILDTPVDLSANTLYGFDLGSPDNAFFELLGIKDSANGGNPYSDGTAYNTGDDGVADNDTELQPGDRVFVVELISSNQASIKSPLNEATDVYRSPTLSWVPGIAATSHDLYVGTDYDEVASSTTPLENLTETSYTLEGLQLGQTYYWRVDEVDSGKTYPGTVWSFTVEPVAFVMDVNSITATASSYVESSGPEVTVNQVGLGEDGLHSMEPNTMWISAESDEGPVWIQYAFDQVYTLSTLDVWNSDQSYEFLLGFGIKEAMIEVSTNGNDWTVLYDNVILDQASGQAKTGITSTVDMNKVQAAYVRITALSNWTLETIGTTQFSLSEVRFSYLPTKARLPEPADSETDVAVDQILSWRSGRYAAEHQLYFGTDVNAVTDGSALVGSITESEFDVSGQDIVYGQTYYWRVDEINEASTSYTGDLWSFSTAEYLVVDDMESYNATNKIFNTWADGFENQHDDNSSQVGLDDPPYVEESIVYGGDQSMPLIYDNKDADMFATAVKTLDGEDWTQGGAETLTLFFLGDRDNEGGELYVVVNTKKVTCDSDLNLGIWKQWNIDLTTLGITPSNITKLTIGIDGVGKGTVYIDEIRLYREAPMVADPVDPGDSGLVLWYEMEEDLSDSSGSKLNGTSDFSLYYDDESLSTGAFNLGSALILNGIDQYVNVPVGNLLPTLTDSTYSIWFNIDSESTGSYMRAFDFGDDTTNYMFLCVRTGSTGGPEFALRSPDSDSAAEQDVGGSSGLSEGWHHLAAVINGTTMSLYADGTLLESDETDTLPADLGATANNWLGQSQFEDSLYDGLLDDFRIYNRALSEGEVRYLAGDR